MFMCRATLSWTVHITPWSLHQPHARKTFQQAQNAVVVGQELSSHGCLRQPQVESLAELWDECPLHLLQLLRVPQQTSWLLFLHHKVVEHEVSTRSLGDIAQWHVPIIWSFNQRKHTSHVQSSNQRKHTLHVLLIWSSDQRKHTSHVLLIWSSEQKKPTPP